MLTDEIKQEIRQYYADIAARLPGFMPRAGQREMIACIANAMAKCHSETYLPQDGENIAVVEGRTGVGKTVGYLVPGIVMAMATKKKLIVSSATVALQEQLLLRDIPALLDLYPRKDEFDLVLAKGRNRYVCPERLIAISGDGGKEDFFGGATWERPPRNDEMDTLAKLQKALDDQTWTGDRDDLPFAVADDLWARTTNDAHGCTGKDCKHYAACPFFAARKRMQNANIIVANHDFVLSSLASESKNFPDPKQSLMIFDEAHHLTEIAVRRGALSHSLGGVVNWLEKGSGPCRKVCEELALPQLALDVTQLCVQLGRALNAVMSTFTRFDGFSDNPVYRFEHGVLDPAFRAVAEKISVSAKALAEKLDEILTAIGNAREEKTHDPDKLNQMQLSIVTLFSRADNVAQVWHQMCDASTEEPLAKWVEQKGADFLVCVCPLSASSMLTRLLWDKAGSAVLTSATLTTLGSFDFLLRSSGLDAFARTAVTSVASPFNYAEQGEILIPPLKSDPKNAEAHTAEIAAILPALLDGYAGNLMLFASRKQMEAVYHAQPAHIQQSILMQGSMPKRQIIATHIDRVENGKTSIIFGLASFGEGLDLPGQLCQQVIIAKIPFPPPDTPIEQAMQEKIEKNGGNAFAQLTLQKASLLLNQWTGRLIRSVTDTGRVVFLDPRMKSKGYGKQLLEALPEFRISYTLPTVPARKRA